MKAFLFLLRKGLQMPNWPAISVAALNLLKPSLKNTASKIISGAFDQSRSLWEKSEIPLKSISLLRKIGECDFVSAVKSRFNRKAQETASATDAKKAPKEATSRKPTKGRAKPVAIWIRYDDGTLEYLLYD